MNVELANIIRWVSVLALSLLVGFLIGYTPDSAVKGDLFISVSYVSEAGPIPVSAAFKDETDELEFGQLIAGFNGHTTATFQFSEREKVDSLKVNFGGDGRVILSGVMVNQGGFSKNHTSQQLRSHLEPNGGFVINDQGLLVLDSDELNRNFQFNSSFVFDKTEDSFCMFGACIFMKSVAPNWFLFSSLITLVLLVVIGLKVSAGNQVKGILLTILVVTLSGMIMHLLQRELANANLKLHYSSTRYANPEFELYYSPNGHFKGDKISIGSVDTVAQNWVEFKIPSGLYRHLRLDIPKDDTLIVSSLEFQFWPFSFSLNGYDLSNFCDLKNDIQFRFNEQKEMVIYTGSSDPFLIITNSDLMSKYLFYQIKRGQYPIWLSIFYFVLIIVPLSFIRPKGKVIMTSVFFIFLTIPSITFLLKEDVLTLETEKRLAFPKPVYQGLPVHYAFYIEGYLDDQFGGRAGLITAWNLLRVKVLGQTSNSAAVVFGEKPWMFYRADGVQEVYENKTPFSKDQLVKMCSVLQERVDWLAYYGIDYYVFFPPLKHTVYEEYLPKRIKKANESSKMDQLINAIKINTDVKIIELRDVLLKAKEVEDRPIYYYVDSHWNLLGAHHAYRKIINKVNDDHPLIGEASEPDDYHWFEMESTDGDLASVISLNTHLLRSDIVPELHQGNCADSVPSIDYVSHESVHPVQTREVKGVDRKMLKLVMNRDSYANFLIPYFSEHFERSVYLWTPIFNAEVIKQEKPDIFMSEMLERFMIDLTIDNPPIVKNELKAFRALGKVSDSETEIVGTQR